MTVSHVEITQEGNLVIFRPDGTFDIKGATEYENTFTQIVDQYEGQHWGLLSIYSEHVSADPQVQQRVWAQLNWCLHQGCDFIGFVVCNEYQQRLVQEVTKDLPFKDVQTFQDESQGMGWMREKLSH